MRRTKFELKILEHFGTFKECERHMKWSPGTVTKIVGGSRELKGSEIETLQDIFETQSYEDFKEIFFARKITTR